MLKAFDQAAVLDELGVEHVGFVDQIRNESHFLC